MDVIVDRCAGLDVHKASVTGCVRTPGQRRGTRHSEVRSFETFEADLGELRAWLVAAGVTQVAMEATGVYWKPLWYALEDAGFELILVNPQHTKALPGRKTDVNDATWLAQLLECGLLRGSFVPPVAIRELRDVTRYRRKLVEDRGREVQRLQKLLEDAQVKLDVVVSDITGVTGRAILAALIAGERDPARLADLARGKLRPKIPLLQRSVPGRFNDHHALLVKALLAHIDFLDRSVAGLDTRVDDLIAPFVELRDRFTSIPGVAKRSAEIIVAEIGADMGRFLTADHLASWAGVCPGNNESAGKRRHGHTRPGDPWLRSTLIECAWAASRTKNTRLAARFWRIARTRGPERAAMALAHTILVICWHLAANGGTYNELGADYYQPRPIDPLKRQQQLVRQLEALTGQKVTLQPAA